MMDFEALQIYPVEDYLFEVRTADGPVNVRIEPTEWDRAVKESEPQKGLFESAGDWRGKILAAESVEDIEKVFDAVGMGDKTEPVASKPGAGDITTTKTSESPMGGNPFSESVIQDVVYHGGADVVTDFSRGARRGRDIGVAYFNDSEDVAKSYAETGLPPGSTGDGLKLERRGAVTKAFVNIKRPITEETDIAEIFDSPKEALSWLDDLMDDKARENISYMIEEGDPEAEIWDEFRSAHYPGALADEATESFGDNKVLGAIGAAAFKYQKFREYLKTRFDGFWYADAESGGNTIIPFSADQIRIIPDQSSPPKQAGSEIFESAAPSVKFKTKKFKLQDSYQFQGMPISVENKAGSIRKGTDPDGHDWQIEMVFDYGYIRRTVGADGEGIDVYVGPDRNAKHVYIVKQHDIAKVKKWPNGVCPKCGEGVHDCACPEFFDEDKVMLGFSNRQAAIGAYLKQYDSDLFLGPVSTMTVEAFRELVTGEKENVKIPLQFVSESAWVGIYRKMIEG